MHSEDLRPAVCVCVFLQSAGYRKLLLSFVCPLNIEAKVESSDTAVAACVSGGVLARTWTVLCVSLCTLLICTKAFNQKSETMCVRVCLC